MDRARLQRLAGILKEDEDFDLSDNPISAYRVGDTRLNMNSYAEWALEDFVTRYLPKIVNKKFKSLRNKPLELKSKEDVVSIVLKLAEKLFSRVESQAADEFQLQDIKGMIRDKIKNFPAIRKALPHINEDEDFDLSDNPLIPTKDLSEREFDIENLSPDVTGDEGDWLVSFIDKESDRYYTAVYNEIKRYIKQVYYEEEANDNDAVTPASAKEEVELNRNKPLVNDIAGLVEEYKRDDLNEDEDFDLSDNPLTPVDYDAVSIELQEAVKFEIQYTQERYYYDCMDNPEHYRLHHADMKACVRKAKDEIRFIRDSTTNLHNTAWDIVQSIQNDADEYPASVELGEQELSEIAKEEIRKYINSID